MFKFSFTWSELQGANFLTNSSVVNFETFPQYNFVAHLQGGRLLFLNIYVGSFLGLWETDASQFVNPRRLYDLQKNVALLLEKMLSICLVYLSSQIQPWKTFLQNNHLLNQRASMNLSQNLELFQKLTFFWKSQQHDFCQTIFRYHSWHFVWLCPQTMYLHRL